MFSVNINHFLSLYEKNAKKIAVRTFTPIDENNNLKKSHGNFDLYFNKKGVLLKSYHFDRNGYVMIYTYNNKGSLDTILQFKSDANVLISTNVKTYDNNDKLIYEKETYEAFEYEAFYEYIDNIKITKLISSDKKNEVYYCYEPFDDFNTIIEIKELNNDDLISWDKLEYDLDKQLTKMISLNKNGDLDAITHYFRDSNDIETGYCFESEDLSYTRKIETVFNENKHWIRKTNYNDNKILFVIERQIEIFAENEIPDDHGNLNDTQIGLLKPDSTFYGDKEYKPQIYVATQVNIPYIKKNFHPTK
jgi:hypothetical protein